MTTLRSDKGATLIEFVLVLPLLLLFTFAIIEFGILLFDKAVITNAAREGARAGVVANYSYDDDGHAYYDPLDGDGIDGVVSRYINPHGLDGTLLINFNAPDTVATEVVWEQNDGQYFVTVTVKYSHNFLVLPNIMGLVGGTFDQGILLAGKTRMRMELAEEDYTYTNYP